MSNVKIGHAVCDENGKSGLTDVHSPGDQTGKEIRVQEWYNREGGWSVYIECTDPVLADEAATLLSEIAASSYYGYSQRRRTTGYKSIKEHGLNAEHAEFDCSSLCAGVYALLGAGNSYRANTRTLEKTLIATGKFKAYRDDRLTSPNRAKRGAIYCTPAAHAAMVLTDGPDAAYEDPKEEAPALVIKGSVSIRKGPGTQYPRVGILHKGDRVPVTGAAENGWYKVDNGYVSCNIPKYVELKGVVKL